jgi:hypothetical protein
MSKKAAKRFAEKVKPLLKRSKEDVKFVRSYSKRQRKSPDWPWNRFLHAIGTNGGVKRWEEEVEPRIDDGEFRWREIERFSSGRRKALFGEVPNPRWRAKLSIALEEIFQRIKKAGGPAAIRNEYKHIKSVEEAIQYWKSWPGIGNKYAREIPMRSYDPLFRKHFALDHRLKTLLKRNFKNRFSYAEGETFLKKVAKELQTDCWTLDTVLFQNYKKLI